MAARLSLERTAFQLSTAVDFSGEVRLPADWLRHTTAAAEAEGHAVAARYLESIVPEGRTFALEAERRAAWEAAQAFNEARRSSIEMLPTSVREQLWLRWDTAGDRRVCPRCDRRDGEIVRATEGFSPGAPLHGGCRCTETIMHESEII